MPIGCKDPAQKQPETVPGFRHSERRFTNTAGVPDPEGLPTCSRSVERKRYHEIQKYLETTLASWRVVHLTGSKIKEPTIERLIAGLPLRSRALYLERQKLKMTAARSDPGISRPSTAEWKAIVAPYQKPSTWRATWQIVDTFVPYALCWVLMYWTVTISWWLTIPLAMIAGALLVRVFIIFHDCGHGSFFKSRVANDITGFIAGIFTLTPYYHWRWEHALHHATSGDLDRRGTGDVWTLTVQEYLESSRWKRFAYRLARNPIVLFFIAPVFLFVVRERFPSPKASRRERHSVWLMNVAILVMATCLSLVFGLKEYLLIQLTVTMTAGAAGVWMFYVQHQFEDAYWERGEEWDYATAALQGSSFYKLPRILQWLSGNIGFHHIHHLSPRVANYNLERCHNSHPLFRDVKPLTLLTSLKSIKFRLWDEKRGRLVGFRHLRDLRRKQKRTVEGDVSTGDTSNKLK